MNPSIDSARPWNTNTSGIRGVSWSKAMKKWKAVLIRDRREVYVEYFTDLEEAGKAIAKARIQYPLPFEGLSFEQKLRAKIDYNPLTGALKWKSRHSGQMVEDLTADRLMLDGYRRVTAGGKSIQAHRVAWLLQTGSFPTNQLDHINGIKDDNRWVNLREATRAQNMHNRKLQKNNKSGVKGVSWQASSKKWRATLKANGIKVLDQKFSSLDEAKAAIETAREKWHGEFSLCR